MVFMFAAIAQAAKKKKEEETTLCAESRQTTRLQLRPHDIRQKYGEVKVKHT